MENLIFAHGPHLDPKSHGESHIMTFWRYFRHLSFDNSCTFNYFTDSFLWMILNFTCSTFKKQNSYVDFYANGFYGYTNVLISVCLYNTNTISHIHIPLHIVSLI